MDAEYNKFIDRYNYFITSGENKKQRSVVNACFEAFHSDKPFEIDFPSIGDIQTFIGLRFYQVTDFFHEEGSSNDSRFSKLARVCMDSQSAMTAAKWDLMMGVLFHDCFMDRQKKGFRFNSPWVITEFSSILLNDSLSHDNPAMTRILCGQGKSSKMEARAQFTPAILKALAARPDKAEIIAQKKLKGILSVNAPLYGIQGFEEFLTRKGRGRQLEDALGL